MKTPIEDAGERLLPAWQHVCVAEHLHRYAVAASLAGGKRVLDIASGEGYGSNLLGNAAAHVLGIDRSLAAVSHASRKYGCFHVRFAQGDATSIPCPDATFDLVVSFETIEHLHGQEAMLAELRRVLKDDGFLLISSPDKKYHGDKDGYVNEFHVKELYENEFLELIASRFPYCTHLRQQVLTCSALCLETVDGPLPLFEGSFAGTAPLTRLSRPSFHLVLAGRTPPPALSGSLFDATDLAEAYAGHQDQEVRNLKAWLHDVNARLAASEAALQAATASRSTTETCPCAVWLAPVKTVMARLYRTFKELSAKVGGR